MRTITSSSSKTRSSAERGPRRSFSGLNGPTGSTRSSDDAGGQSQSLELVPEAESDVFEPSQVRAKHKQQQQHEQVMASSCRFRRPGELAASGQPTGTTPGTAADDDDDDGSSHRGPTYCELNWRLGGSSSFACPLMSYHNHHRRRRRCQSHLSRRESCCRPADRPWSSEAEVDIGKCSRKETRLQQQKRFKYSSGKQESNYSSGSCCSGPTGNWRASKGEEPMKSGHSGRQDEAVEATELSGCEHKIIRQCFNQKSTKTAASNGGGGDLENSKPMAEAHPHLPRHCQQQQQHRKQHHQLPSFKESCSSSVSMFIKLILICHLIQSLVTTISDRGGERERQREQEEGEEDFSRRHFSAIEIAYRKQNSQTSAVSRSRAAAAPEVREYPALFISAVAAAETDADDNDLGASGWLGGEHEELRRRRRRKQSQSMDRLLSEEIIIKPEVAQPAAREHRTSPLDIIKHQHQHNHQHHRHRHHHHHHRKEASSSGDEPEVESARFRRHQAGGGFYDGAADRPVVASRGGLVRGLTQKLFTGKFVDAFLGIPYAKPPLGTYRFRHPQPSEPWPGELDASKLPQSCYQVNDTFFGANFQGTLIWNANTPLSEDCLYLNIWTPFGVANTTVPSTPNKVYRPPPMAESSKGSRRPVLVWIFGGGFYYGTSTLALYEGGLLASEEDIIVVSINYRVSALGFLYFGRPDAPGNAGMFDQMLALQWIQDNIDQFGGDPSRVTIFGESAGAVSAAFHLLSPLSRNLFSQAILQSGAATCPWGCMEPREIMTNGLKLAHLLNCPSNASELDAVLGCLLRIDPMTLVLTAQDVDPAIGLLNFPFVPVVDGSFLLEPPSESLIKSNFKRARILLGSNYDEGSAFLIYLTEFNHCPGDTDAPAPDPSTKAGPEPAAATKQSQDKNNNNYPPAEPALPNYGELRDQEPMELAAPPSPADRQQQQAAALTASEAAAAAAQPAGSDASSEGGARSNLPPNYGAESNPCKPNESPALTREGFLRTLNKHLNPYAEHPVGKEAIVFEYTNWNNPHDSVSNYDALDKIVGDFHFTCHVNEFAQRYAQTGNAVYMYYFKQRSTVSQWPKWMGVMHGDEIAYVFGEPLNHLLNYTSKEVELSRRMMKYWANFAKFGNPTKLSENVSMAEKWPEYANNRQYFELHGEVMRVGRGPRSKQCAFWAHYLPKMIDSYDHSQCPATQGGGASSAPQYRCPPMYHPLDPSYQATDHRNNSSGLLNNLPSLVIVSLSVILVLSIIGLLVYAKRTGKLELNLNSGSSSD